MGEAVGFDIKKSLGAGTRIMSVWSFFIKATVNNSEKTQSNKKLRVSISKQNP